MSTKVKVTAIKEAIDGFLLSCKVGGKSYGTFECYTDKLKGFFWYATITNGQIKTVRFLRKRYIILVHCGRSYAFASNGLYSQ